MSNVYSVMYSTEAKSDLLEIYVYIAFELGVPNIAKNQINRIRKKIRSHLPMTYHPLGHIVSYWRKMKIGVLIVPYLLHWMKKGKSRKLHRPDGNMRRARLS